MPNEVIRQIALLKRPVAVAEDRHYTPGSRYGIDIEILRTDHKVYVNDGIVDTFFATLGKSVFVVVFDAVFKSVAESKVATRILIKQGVEECDFGVANG